MAYIRLGACCASSLMFNMCSANLGYNHSCTMIRFYYKYMVNTIHENSSIIKLLFLSSFATFLHVALREYCGEIISNNLKKVSSYEHVLMTLCISPRKNNHVVPKIGMRHLGFYKLANVCWEVFRWLVRAYRVILTMWARATLYMVV